MKSKKIYAMFLSTAIAATTCVYASDPKSSSLPCSAAPGSMLGAPGDQSEHTQSRSEGSEETPANTLEGFDHAATPNSPEPQSASLSAAPTEPAASNVEQTNDIETVEKLLMDMTLEPPHKRFKKDMAGTCNEDENEQVALPNNSMCEIHREARDTLIEIVKYIFAHRDESDEALRQWVDFKLQNGRLSCCYLAPESGYSSNYCYHYCTRHDVVHNIVDFFKHQRGTSSDYQIQCVNSITAFLIASAANLPQPEPVDSESGSQPQNCPPMLRIMPTKEIISKMKHLPEYGYMLGMRTVFISPSAYVSKTDWSRQN